MRHQKLTAGSRPDKRKRLDMVEQRAWIPATEFCELYSLPRERPPRANPPRYPTCHEARCRKCVEALAAKRLVEISKVGGRTYVSTQSALAFGKTRNYGHPENRIPKTSSDFGSSSRGLSSKTYAIDNTYVTCTSDDHKSPFAETDDHKTP